jgi:phosphate transport system substrate-binding protein
MSGGENNMKKKIMILLMALTLTIGGVVNAAAETVTASGSTALLPIVKQAATEYTAATVQVAGGGSGTGLQQVTAGIVNIGDSDVYAADGSGLVDHQVAIEPFVFVINPDVLKVGLTHDQIVGIFSGKITNWQQVGGKNEKISVIMRQASSGTRMTIQSLVMGNEQFTANAAVFDSSGAVRTAVQRTPGAIGYVDLAYVTAPLRALSYDGVAPTIENVKNGTYKLVAYGHMYTKGEATGQVKAFIEYIQSKDFQARVLPQFKFVSTLDVKKIEVKKVQTTNKPAAKPVTKPNKK